jgi:hypothetical protein
MPQKRKSNKRTSKRRSKTHKNYNGSGITDWYKNLATNIDAKRLSAKQQLQKIQEKGLSNWYKDREANKTSIQQYKQFDLFEPDTMKLNPIYEMIIYLINFSLLIYSIAPIEFMDALNIVPLDKIDEISLILADNENRKLFMNYYITNMKTSYNKNIFINKLINTTSFKGALQLNFTGPSFENNLYKLIGLILESHFYYLNKNNNKLLEKLTNKRLTNEDITEQCSLMSQTMNDNNMSKSFNFNSDIMENIINYKDFLISLNQNRNETSKIGDLWKHFNAIYNSLINLCSSNKMKSIKSSSPSPSNYNLKDNMSYYGEPKMDQPFSLSPPPMLSTIYNEQITSTPLSYDTYKPYKPYKPYELDIIGGKKRRKSSKKQRRRNK